VTEEGLPTTDGRLNEHVSETAKRVEVKGGVREGMSLSG
jgi:hypothetical protein